MSNYYIEYPLDESQFTDNEKKIIALLKEAGKKVGELFYCQVNGECHFYPEGVTKEEIIDASKTDSKILDPYTLVKKNAEGKLYSSSYENEYSEELKEISQLFLEASKYADNESFKHYLETASREFLNGDYVELERAWVAIDNSSKLHLMTGPIGSYADNFFGLKKAYNFNFTYTDTASTFNPTNYVDVIRHMLPHFGSKARQNVSADRIKVRIDKVIAIGGRNAGLPARAVNYPDDIKMIDECGIKIVVYTNNIEKRDGGMLLPLLRGFLDPRVGRNFSNEDIMANAVRLVMAHEITEAIFQYPGAWDRLKGMFNHVYELHSSIVGIKACGFQVIKGALAQKDLEAILYIMLMRTFSDWYVRKNTPQVENYLSGYRVFFNYCKEQGAITVEKDYISVNSSEMFLCADQLANIVMNLYDNATEEEAKEFFDKYTSEFMYEHFSVKLASYDFK